MINGKNGAFRTNSLKIFRRSAKKKTALKGGGRLLTQCLTWFTQYLFPPRSFHFSLCFKNFSVSFKNFSLRNEAFVSEKPGVCH